MNADDYTPSEQDRLSANENIAFAVIEYDRELSVIEVLDMHRLRFDESSNLGYYRTFIECSCGAGWWFGEHEGDPSAHDRWAIHRAEVLRSAFAASQDVAP